MSAGTAGATLAQQASNISTLKKQKMGCYRDAVPTVHGKGAAPMVAGPHGTRARLSNHQRNLSLDFR